MKKPPLTNLDQKAMDFFLSPSSASNSSAYKFPEMMECPQCKQQMTLTKRERTRGAFMCTNCNLFCDAKEFTAGAGRDEHPPSRAPAEVSAVQKMSEDACEYLLPTHIKCPHCETMLELSQHERQTGLFICPTCNPPADPDAIEKDEFLDEFEEKYLLKPFVVCPKCGEELELEKSERILGEFVCPECKRFSEFTNETVSAATQYVLPENPLCPECSYENTLSTHERNEETFVCTRCKKVIQHVDE